MDSAVEAASRIASERGDAVFAGVLLIAAALFIVWVSYRDRQEDEERDEQRQAEETRRSREQTNFVHKLATENAQQLGVIAQAIDRSSEATEKMAAAATQTQHALQRLAEHHEQNRAAIVSAIEAIESHRDGDVTGAADAIRRARMALMTHEMRQQG